MKNKSRRAVFNALLKDFINHLDISEVQKRGLDFYRRRVFEEGSNFSIDFYQVARIIDYAPISKEQKGVLSYLFFEPFVKEQKGV